MNAKDLMVGNWVILGKKIHRCSNIFGHTNDVLLDNGVITNVSQINPIPLTRVHLVKNGFMATDENDIKFCFKDGYVINVYFDESFNYLWISDADKELSMEVQYVHELQNAMRLMGIEKEIKL